MLIILVTLICIWWKNWVNDSFLAKFSVGPVGSIWKIKVDPCSPSWEHQHHIFICQKRSLGKWEIGTQRWPLKDGLCGKMSLVPHRKNMKVRTTLNMAIHWKCVNMCSIGAFSTCTRRGGKSRINIAFGSWTCVRARPACTNVEPNETKIGPFEELTFCNFFLAFSIDFWVSETPETDLTPTINGQIKSIY